MTAQIKGFVTRADAGLRKPRSFSSKITPQHGGVAPHYGGPTQPAANPDADHAVCIKTWRAWQNYHMDTHGWADLAYTGGVCNHGYAFAGRGVGVRTAANGSNFGNQNFYAVVWIGGDGQSPTKAALDAMDWWVVELRSKGAGRAVRPHLFFRSTGCPGPSFVQYAADRHMKDIAFVTATSEGIDPVIAALQGLVHHKDRDGLWGPQTDLDLRKMRTAARSRQGEPSTLERFDVRFAQTHVGATVSGMWNPQADLSLIYWIRLLQKTLAVPMTGRWDKETEAAFQAVRTANLNQY